MLFIIFLILLFAVFFTGINININANTIYPVEIENNGEYVNYEDFSYWGG